MYVYVVHSISFQTNFYDFRFKWKVTAGIGIHPTEAWLSQLVNFKIAIWTLGERYAIRFCFKLRKNAMRWKLDQLLWPRDQETAFPVEACLLSKTQEGQTEQIHPQTFDDRFFDSTGMIYMRWVPTGQTVNNVLREFMKRFKWTATGGIGIHLTKAWLSQLVNFKNTIWTWGHFRRTMYNKILF